MPRASSSVEDDADDAVVDPRSLPGRRRRDLSRAKLSASLKWLLCKAYDGCVPLDFREPLPAVQEDTVSAVHMNLGVRSLLVNSKLYCAACERLFGAAWNTTFNGHWSVIQSLARHGYYVAVDDGAAVSDADLSDVQPFNTGAHLAVIETMMAAHVAETAPVVRVVQAIRSVTSFNASKELPCSSEDALLLWMNKIWTLTAEARHKASQLLVLQSAPPAVRLDKSQLAPRDPEQSLGLCAENVVETLRDGRCIATTIGFYFPQRIKLEDVCLTPTGSVHDATRNWQLIGAAICSTVNGLATSVHFAAADLYDDRQCREMKSNILSLVAEVFCACVAVSSPPPAAASVAASQAAVPLAGKPVAIPPSSVVTGCSQTLISEATKRSFMSGQQRSASVTGGTSAAVTAFPVEPRLAAAAGSTTSRSDGSPAAAAASPSLKQPLLTKRHRELTSATGQPTKASFCAWEDKNGSDAAGLLSSSEPTDASGAQVLACSSRWGVYPFNNDRRSPVEDVESFTAPPDSARTYTLPSKTVPTDAAAQAAAPLAAGTSLRHAAPSPAMTVASVCDSAAAADQECARILMGGAVATCPPDLVSVADGEVRASANDTETPVTARSLVSNTMLWCDDDDDVTVSLDSEVAGGGEGFYLRRRVLGDSVASGAGCGASLAWSPPPPVSVDASSAKELDSGRIVAVPDAARQVSEEESCIARGVSRTTSFAELKHFISTPVNAQPAASCAGDATSPRDDIRSPSAASNSSSGVVGSGALLSLKTEFIKAKSSQSGAKSPKKTTFAMKQTTWAENAAKQKSTGGLPSALIAPAPSDGAGSMEASVTSNSSSSGGGGSSVGGGSLTSSGIGGDLALASEGASSSAARQHADVRLLLAERRRAIEAGRQAAGAARGEQRDEISREAFLQAVLKQQQQRSAPAQHSSSAAADAVGSGLSDFQRPVRSHGTVVASDDGFCAEERPSPVRAKPDDHAASTISADQPPYHLPCGTETPREQPDLESATAFGAALPSSTAAAEFAADRSSNDSTMAGAMDDYGASLDKLSSSITELQFELARLALKQKHMEDAAAAAAAVAATAPADGAVMVPMAFPASSRHATYALPSQTVAASSLNSLAAVAVNGGLTAADSGVWHSSDTSVSAFTTATPALLNQAAAGTAAATAPVCSTAVHRDSKPFHLTSSSASTSQAPKASSRHGTVMLSAAAAASQAAQNSWPISAPSRGGSAPPNGGTAPISGTGAPPATGSAAVRPDGGGSGAFFVPVQATVPSSSQRRSSADAAAAAADAAAAGKLPTAHVKHQTGKRATWCVTTPGTDRAAVQPWLVAAIEPSSVDETMPIDDGGLAVDVENNVIVRPLDGSCDGSDEDMQRRRERIQQLEQRRLEDVQRRRRAKEVESERRREELRAKELAAERKKAEERQRRELILQQYKERKAEDDPARAVTSGDGGGRIIVAPVQTRPRSSAARRSPANVNRHSSGAVLGGQLDSLLLPTARDQAAPSGAVTHRRSISPSMSASDIASLNGKHSKKVSVQHGPVADAVFGNSHGALQAVVGGSAYSQQQQRQMLRVSSPDPSAASSAVDGDPAGGAAALKLFVQPSFKSNRGIIINAISHCVLAGTVNTDVKNKVLEELARSDAKHFLILFRDSHLQYRGIYAYNLETEEVAKVSGQGPKVISEKMFERFYKYNSGSKSFSEVTSTKHLSVSIDAITIKDALWQKKPSAMLSTTKRGV